MITKGQFLEAAKAIVEQDKLDDKVSEALQAACPESHVFYSTQLLEPAIKLLEQVSGDDYGWLSYWIFELERGKKWNKGKASLCGVNIKLKTLGDVWDAINKSKEL